MNWSACRTRPTGRSGFRLVLGLIFVQALLASFIAPLDGLLPYALIAVATSMATGEAATMTSPIWTTLLLTVVGLAFAVTRVSRADF